MAKRSVTTEIEIAALSAAIELVGRPEFCREWVKEEFADREVKAVRVTSDIVEAVEEKMLERMTRISKILEAELAELKDRDDDEENSEPTIAEFRSWFEDCIAAVIREESAKGNKISVKEAHTIISKRIII
jgi:hypothetical protein